MDSELFANWFSNHFLKYAVSSRPLMLILDGHSSHYTLDLFKTAADNDVALFCLPPHTMADSQPLDTSCFGPLKRYWVEVCRQFMFSNPGRAISKFQFSTLFSEAWSKGMSINNIVSGFRSTGICPFKPGAILDKLPKDSVQKDLLDQEVNELPDNEGSVAHPTTREDSSSNEVFTLVEIELFEKCFENECDIFIDQQYVAWLHQYHPSFLPLEMDQSPPDLLNSD